MTIAQMREVGNRAVSRIPKDMLIVGLVLSCSLFAFLLGMLSERQRAGNTQDTFNVVDTPTVQPEALSGAVVEAVGAVTAQKVINSALAPSTAEGTKMAVKSQNLPYVGSRSGTTYYLATCKSAKRIKTENRVWFASAEEAKRAGRHPAKNCPGL